MTSKPGPIFAEEQGTSEEDVNAMWGSFGYLDGSIGTY